MVKLISLAEISRRVKLELLKLESNEIDNKPRKKFEICSDPYDMANIEEWRKAFEYFGKQKYNRYGNRVDRSKLWS